MAFDHRPYIFPLQHFRPAEDLTILNVMAATNHLETLLQASKSDATWLDYSVSSDTEEDDSTSSIEVLTEDDVESVSLQV
jgi:hypothetical protein